MARQLRIQYSGAIYHIMARGDHGNPIFSDDRDREVFLKTLAQACDKTGWLIYAYVLMGNHYHLLLETPEPNLVLGMKWLQGTYTRRYNVRHHVLGHLFQGRYRGLVVDGEDETYLGVLSTYIHLNPTRAGLIQIGKQSLRSYPWSSYPAYLKAPAERVSWLRAARVLASVMRGPDDSSHRAGYGAVLESRTLELADASRRAYLEEQWQPLRRGWYLGSAKFKDRLLRQIGQVMENRRRSSYAGEAPKAHDENQAASILESGLKVLGLTPDKLPLLPKGAAEKRVLAWWLRRQTTVSRRWISERLVMGDESRVTQGVWEVEQTMDPRLADGKQRLQASQSQEEEDSRPNVTHVGILPEFLD